MSKKQANIDNAIIHGMNTVDHPATLQDGECELLVNAYPGNPPEIRNGCFFNKTELAGKPIPPAQYLINDTIKSPFYIARNVYDNDRYDVYSFDGNDMNGMLTLQFNDNEIPVFDMLQLHSCIYLVFNKRPYHSDSGYGYRGLENYALGHKVIEYNGQVIRDMCIDYSAYVGYITEEEEEGGQLASGKYYSYSFTYVRRVDTTAYTNGTPIDGIILPAGMTNKIPKATTIYMPGAVEGPEQLKNRETTQVTGVNNAIRLQRDSCAEHNGAIAQGATHIRIFRTQGQATEEDALGATRYWLVDIPIAGEVGMSSGTYLDKTADDALDGELNSLFMDQYTSAPYAKFAEYHNGRMWLYGIQNKAGYGMYSEVAGGDGCTDTELAIQYPQKYASIYKPTKYYVDCEHADGLKDTGIARLNNDLYFYKESKIFALYGGDPQSGTIENVSETIGCAFPFTLTKCEVKGLFGECHLFISKKGPYVLQAGGVVNPFSQFKIKELWPDNSRELFQYLDSNYDEIVETCTASFFNNAWWIFYKTPAGESKVFGYYFSRDLINEPGAPNGPLQLKFADELSSLVPVCLAVKDVFNADLITYRPEPQLEGTLDRIYICNFLGNRNADGSNKCIDEIELNMYPSNIEDYETSKHKFDFKVFSKRLYPGPKPESISALLALTLMCHFEDDSDEDNDLILKVVSDYIRFNQAVEFISNQIINNSHPTAPLHKIRNNIQVWGREGNYGTFFQYYLKKKIPESGLFHLLKAKVETYSTNLEPEFLSGLGAIADGAIEL